MKSTVKILALLLALIMVLSMVACSSESNDTEEEESESQASTTADDSDKSALKDSGLDKKDFNNELFVIRYATATTFVPDTFNINALQASKDIVSQASVNRDRAFEEYTNTTIAYVPSDTNPNDSPADMDSIRILNESGELAEIDMLSTGARTVGTLVKEMLLADLNEYGEYIHADSYYYSTGINSQMTLGGKLFAVSGYHTTLNYRYTQSIAVNVQELGNTHNDENKIDELYELAVNNRWTTEKMFEYGKNYATGPVDQDPLTDRYTLIADLNCASSWFFCLGGTIVEKDVNDLPVITISNHTELLTDVKGFLADNTDEVYIAPDNKHGDTYGAGNSLFLQSPLTAFSGFADSYGIESALLPMPVKNEGDEYISNAFAWNTNLVGIPYCSSDIGMASYCLEIYMAFSYDLIFPEFYEKLFKVRYSENEYESQMFDIVTNSMYIDYVSVYQWQKNPKADLIRNIVAYSTAEVGSSVTSIANEVKPYIDTFISNYDFG